MARPAGTKSNPVVDEYQLFGFLTTEPNDVVGAVHPKAMPVFLTEPEAIEQWLTGSTEEALKLQRPLPDGLKVVMSGEKDDHTEGISRRHRSSRCSSNAA